MQIATYEESNTVLSTKEQKLDDGFKQPKRLALDVRNAGATMRRQLFNRTEIDIGRPPASTRCGHRSTQRSVLQPFDCNKPDDSLFITTYRTKSRGSIREHVTDPELVTTEK